MSKMHLALIDQSLEKSRKSWKKFSKFSSHDISKELKIDHKTF